MLAEVDSLPLQKRLDQSRIAILISGEIAIPVAANRRTILLPENLMNELSQEEYEAVIAHEAEHLKWKDPIVKMIFLSICSIFWWMPTTRWMKKIEDDQEEACDMGLHAYGLDTYPLATALLKAVNHQRVSRNGTAAAAICHLDASKNTIKRLQDILRKGRAQENGVSLRSVAGVVICSLAFLSFWMC